MTDTGRRLFVGHDLGTGGDKAVLVDAAGGVLASAFEPYPLAHPRPGWAEQDPEDWWRAAAAATRALLVRSGAAPDRVAGIAFAGQMLALAPIDAAGRPTRPAISWLDGRADAQAARLVRRLGGARVITAAIGACPSGKDVICKIAWIRENEPHVYARTHAFCDATGYLVARATRRIGIDHTGAAGTGLLDRRRRRWSRPLAALVGAPLGKLPPTVPCAAVAGGLTPDAAEAMGLRRGTPVVAGLGDVTAAALGSGALDPGEAHVSLGTSGWICATAKRPKDLPRHGVYALPSPDPERFLMVGETETAGACADWLAALLGLTDDAGRPRYADLERLVGRAEPGASGLLFAPWLFGERAPVSDAALRGAFVGLSLEHRPEHLARAVLDGVAVNLSWLMEALGDAVTPGAVLRAVGGGALSGTWVQAIADATGRTIAVVERPQDAGAVGAALLAAVGADALPDVRAIRRVVGVAREVRPRAEHRATYRNLERALREVQPALASASRLLGATTSPIGLGPATGPGRGEAS